MNIIKMTIFAVFFIPLFLLILAIALLTFPITSMLYYIFTGGIRWLVATEYVMDFADYLKEYILKI